MVSGLAIGALSARYIGIVVGIMLIDAVEHALDGDWEIW